LASLLWLLVPAGSLTFAVWSVYATFRWGANQPADARRGVLKWVFAALLLSLVGNAVARRPYGPAESCVVPPNGSDNNGLKDAAQHLGSATTNAAVWIRFTFTAVELRKVGGTNWLAVDYQDDVHGACSKAFPWELTLPNANAEVRTSEFVKEYQVSPAVRHQRIEYKLPDAMKREQLDQLRINVEKALREKSVRLGLGEKSLLFGVSTTEGVSIKAWVEVKPPSPVSP
jgi:hypothetical protein